MPSKQQLEKHGVKIDEIKALAEKVNTLSDDHPFKAWINRESARIRDGVDRNLKDWRLWWALDQAYDAPFHQISYTLLRSALEKDYDDNSVMSLLNDFGVTHLLEDRQNPDGSPCLGPDGKPQKDLNIPVFFNIFVPLCAAYLKVRWAKLYNDRNQVPLYKYEPAYSTKENRLRCDIITSAVSVISQQLGYNNDEKDSIFQALHYGMSLAFPRESWWKETQLGSDGKENIVRQGLRFNMPPRERTYFDMSERLSSINTNTGVSYSGYWCISKYSEVLDKYWNTDKISFGDGDIITSNSNFFSNIYPCTLRFPSRATQAENDREQEYSLYTSDDMDAAVLRTEHFTTVIPKDVGIGDYEYPVTFRMVIANYNTPLYIEPLFCSQAAYYGYDSEGNRAKNASLTLEVMPFQDQISNVLMQWILSVKHNLRSVTFVDTDVVPKPAIDALKNMGEKSLRSPIYVQFSSRDSAAKLAEHSEAFISPTFNFIPTSELRGLIEGLLSMLERALQFSAQEIGQAATHEQSATESNIIHNNIGNRVRFTGTFIDDGMWAKKKMIYDALMECGDDDLYAEISPSYTNTKEEFEELCKKLDIKIQDWTDSGRAVVKASKKHLIVEAFVSNRDGDNRVNNPAMATAASQVLGVIVNNPILMQSIGSQQVVDLVNQICSLLNLPKDFVIKYNPNQEGVAPEQQMAMLQEQMKPVLDEVAKRIEAGEKAAAQAIQQGDQQVAQGVMSAVGEQLTQVVEKIKQIEGATMETQAVVARIIESATPPPPPPPGMV